MSFRAFSSLPRALGQRAAPLRAVRVSQFHTSRPLLVTAGDTLPNRDVLFENSPGSKVNLADEFTNIKRGLVIGVPAAFSPACSNQHIPSYVNHPKVADIIKEGGKVVVVSVNDPFV
jgi:peroxiredoxin 5